MDASRNIFMKNAIRKIYAQITENSVCVNIYTVYINTKSHKALRPQSSWQLNGPDEKRFFSSSKIL